MAAWDLVVESRPPREGCECYGAWALLRNIEARVLCYYPRVAERLSPRCRAADRSIGALRRKSTRPSHPLPLAYGRRELRMYSSGYKPVNLIIIGVGPYGPDALNSFRVSGLLSVRLCRSSTPTPPRPGPDETLLVASPAFLLLAAFLLAAFLPAAFLLLLLLLLFLPFFPFPSATRQRGSRHEKGGQQCCQFLAPQGPSSVRCSFARLPRSVPIVGAFHKRFPAS